MKQHNCHFNGQFNIMRIENSTFQLKLDMSSDKVLK